MALDLDPLMFEGLIGTAIAHGSYRDLFDADGLPKAEAGLRKMKWAAAYIDRECEERRKWREANARD